MNAPRLNPLKRYKQSAQSRTSQILNLFAFMWQLSFISLVDVVSHAVGFTVCHSLNTCGKDIVLFVGILLSKYYLYDLYNECLVNVRFRS